MQQDKERLLMVIRNLIYNEEFFATSDTMFMN